MDGGFWGFDQTSLVVRDKKSRAGSEACWRIAKLLGARVRGSQEFSQNASVLANRELFAA
jgi:hypothetical protein